MICMLQTLVLVLITIFFNLSHITYISPFHIYDSPHHNVVSLPWYITHKQIQRHPINNVEVSTILYNTPKTNRKKIAVSHLPANH